MISISEHVAGEKMPVSLSYGGGTNSAAIVVELIKRGFAPPDVILFADTGAEQPHTYESIKTMSVYAVANGYPEITVVRVHQPSKKGGIYEYCTANRMLPAIAYGHKSCSVIFKIEPQNKYINERFGNVRHIRIVGFDYDEIHRAAKEPPVNQVCWYPLIEWEMGRAECVESIANAGLPLPGKSSCFFCPNNRPHEIKLMAQRHPDLAAKAIALEDFAAERRAEDGISGGIAGLGRSWRWKDLLATDDMWGFPDIPREAVCGCYDGGDP